MILDQIKNATLYEGLHPGIRRGLEHLATGISGAFAPGREALDDDRVYAMRQEYISKPRESGVWESHRRHADIQFIHEGEEQIGYAPVSSLETTRPYDERDDYALYQGPGQFFRLGPGWFAIFFPEDGHMPGVAATASAHVRKVVVKVRLS